MARFTFFVGKGGVGKTTVSSAYALHQAAKRPRRPILLLSTDPAHSLGDILQIKLGDAPKRLPVPGRLWVRQLDAEKQINSFLKTEREEILALLNRGSLFTGDELAALLDTSLPGMAEVAALLAIHELLDSKFEEIVVDTAPMGHAVRLFQMPQHFARFLDVLEAAASRDVVLARHFGGHVQREPAVERWSRMVDRVESALSMEGSKLVLVTTPEPFSLNQAARSVSFISRREAAEPVCGGCAESRGCEPDELSALPTKMEAGPICAQVYSQALSRRRAILGRRSGLSDPRSGGAAPFWSTRIRRQATAEFDPCETCQAGPLPA